MPVIHFLNVKQGDCSIITHHSGHTTVIDVCNAKAPEPLKEAIASVLAMGEKGVTGNFNQKKYPVNPISYMKERGMTEVFRFIATHPDMDHLDGIKAFFEEFQPTNFWDTDNNEEKEDFDEDSGYNLEDWEFYKSLGDEKPETNPKRLTFYSGAKNKYFNIGADGSSGGDGLHILSPTLDLVTGANECGEYNDCSYVLLYKTGDDKIVFAGDSHDKCWEHI